MLILSFIFDFILLLINSFFSELLLILLFESSLFSLILLSFAFIIIDFDDFSSLFWLLVWFKDLSLFFGLIVLITFVSFVLFLRSSGFDFLFISLRSFLSLENLDGCGCLVFISFLSFSCAFLSKNFNFSAKLDIILFFGKQVNIYNKNIYIIKFYRW